MKKHELPISTADYGLMLISAVRYALGRMTYIVSTACAMVKASRELLDDKTVYVMIQDIERHVKDDLLFGRDPYGMECDRKDWTDLL